MAENRSRVAMEYSNTISESKQNLSILRGPIDPPLLNLTLGQLLDFQTIHHGRQECLVVPWTGARWTYNDLSSQSSALAVALIHAGVKAGDRLAIMAGNCEQYAAIFFAAAKIGAILVILNNAYTAKEAMYALRFTEAKTFFTTFKIGKADNTALLDQVTDMGDKGPSIVIIRGPSKGYTTYEDLIQSTPKTISEALQNVSKNVLPHQVVNLQFTSGTTGLPKAAMLTHQYVKDLGAFDA